MEGLEAAIAAAAASAARVQRRDATEAAEEGHERPEEATVEGGKVPTTLLVKLQVGGEAQGGWQAGRVPLNLSAPISVSVSSLAWV